MKYFFLIVTLFCTTFIFGQKKPTDKPLPLKKITEPQKRIRYCCIKGDYSDSKSGECPVDHSLLLPEGTYYCIICDTTENPSKCINCEHDIIKTQCPVMVIGKEKQR